MTGVGGGIAAARELMRAPEARVGSLEWPDLVFVAAAGAVPYGAVVGWWTSPELALYAAIKLPAVLVGTLLFTFPFGWVAARSLGLDLSLRDAARLTTAPLAVAALLLASLAPPALLFTLHIDPPSPAARSTHHLLYLFHTGAVALAALFGTRELWRGLRERAGFGAAAKTYLAWIGVYAFVAGEVAWILRPFVGSVFMPVRFLRRDALDGNVYEFIFEEIVPHLLGS